MRVLDCAQRSPEWFTAKLGRVGSSQAADMLATLKSGGEAASRRDLRVALALERLTGCSQGNGYQNADMTRGIELEPAALAAYEAATGTLVQPCGVILHDDLLACYSPDGVVNDDGLLELKCPRSATHLGYLRGGIVPKEYLPQLTHALWITGRQWIDFGSYDEKMPEPLRFFCVRHRRNEQEVMSYEVMARSFLTEVQREVDAIHALMHAAV